MKNIFLITIFLIINFSYSQVGINNVFPKATLEVTGEPTITTIADGIIAPRIKRSELIAKTIYTADQVGAIVYVTDLSGVTNFATSEVLEIGYYNFNGLMWKSMNSGSKFSYGDIKMGIQPADHNGWVKLDGRPINLLTVSQQAQANSLSILINLPDANNTVLMQNGMLLGSINGTMTRTLTRNNLPIFNLNGITSGDSAGVPTGNVNVMDQVATMQSAGIHFHSNPSVHRNTSTDGNHFHNYYRTSNVGEIVAGGVGAIAVGGENTNELNATFNSGNHAHTIDVGNYDTNYSGNHAHIMNPHNHIATFVGVALGQHLHALTTENINNTGNQTSIDVTPRSLSVNTFIYLGE